jgi:hypothetical protein
MAKKDKKKKEAEVSDPRVTALGQMYDSGNFAGVRRQSAALKNDDALSEKDSKTVNDLYETVQLDPTALYVGLGSLAFISLVAFLSLSAN